MKASHEVGTDASRLHCQRDWPVQYKCACLPNALRVSGLHTVRSTVSRRASPSYTSDQPLPCRPRDLKSNRLKPTFMAEIFMSRKQGIILPGQRRCLCLSTVRVLITTRMSNKQGVFRYCCKSLDEAAEAIRLLVCEGWRSTDSIP